MHLPKRLSFERERNRCVRQLLDTESFCLYRRTREEALSFANDFARIMSTHHHTCGLCGNPRRVFKERTLAEQRFYQNWIDYMDGMRW